MHKREMDLTSGNLFTKLLFFSVPIMLTTFLQLLYSTVDLVVVSYFGGGVTSMDAVGANGSLISVITIVFINLSLGASVAMGNYKGANDVDRATKVLNTALILAVFFGLLVGLFGVVFSHQLLAMVGTPDSILDKASIYLSIYFIGMPFVMIYNYGTNVLRSLGDSRRPFYILLGSGVINIVGDYVFDAFFGWGVAGVAAVTVLCQAFSAIMVIVYLSSKKNDFVRFDIRHVRFDQRSFFEIIRIGIPAGLEGLAFAITNVMIQSSLGLYSFTVNQNEVIAGNVASGNIEGYIYAVLNAITISSMAFVSQNYGAKNKKNVKRSFWYALIWDAIFASAIGVFIIVFADKLSALYVSSSDGIDVNAAIEAGRGRLILLAATYFLCSFMDLGSGYLMGMRYSTTPAVIVFAGCTITRIAFLLAVFPLVTFHTIVWLYAIYPISWAFTGLLNLIAIFIVQPKAFARLDNPNMSLHLSSMARPRAAHLIKH